MLGDHFSVFFFTWKVCDGLATLRNYVGTLERRIAELQSPQQVDRFTSEQELNAIGKHVRAPAKPAYGCRPGHASSIQRMEIGRCWEMMLQCNGT